MGMNCWTRSRGVKQQITQWQNPDLQVAKCSVCPKIIIIIICSVSQWLQKMEKLSDFVQQKACCGCNQSMYYMYLNCFSNSVYTHAAETRVEETKVEESNEDNWHRKYGHISVRSLQKLARDELVTGFDYMTRQKRSASA